MVDKINLLISGKMRSGKTYTTRAIIEHIEKMGYKVKHLSLSRRLKLLLDQGFNRQDRPAMQFMGTEVMRVFAGKYFGTEDFWVNLMLEDMKRWKNDYDLFICDDCRFPSEVERLRKCGFKVVRLATTRELQLSRGGEGAKETVNLDHPSELALDTYEGTGFFDLETNPNDSIDEIVDKIFEEILTEFRGYAMVMRNSREIINTLRNDPAQRVFYSRNEPHRGWWLDPINTEMAPCPYTPSNVARQVHSTTILEMLKDKILQAFPIAYAGKSDEERAVQKALGTDNDMNPTCCWRLHYTVADYPVDTLTVDEHMMLYNQATWDFNVSELKEGSGLTEADFICNCNNNYNTNIGHDNDAFSLEMAGCLIGWVYARDKNDAINKFLKFNKVPGYNKDYMSIEQWAAKESRQTYAALREFIEHVKTRGEKEDE